MSERAAVTEVEELYLDAITARIRERGLEQKQVAALAGVTVRTVRRVLKRETRRMETLRRFLAGLRIELQDNGRPTVGHNRTQSDNVGQIRPKSDTADSERPVVGWGQAALAVDVTVRTLHRDRLRYGCTLTRPWWKSRAACREWYERLIAGPRLRDEPTEVLLGEARQEGGGGS